MTMHADPDPRFRTLLVERAPRHAPEGLFERAMSQVGQVGQQRGWLAGAPILRFAVPIVAAVALLVAGIGTAVLISTPEPPVVLPGPSVTPTTEPATPTRTPSASQTPTPPSAAVLIAGPATCTDPDAGFSVAVPDGWYTNDAGSEIDRCRFFAPEPFELIDPDAPPDVPVRLGLLDGGDFGFTDADIVERTELRIAGLPAERLVAEGVDGRSLVYIIGLDGSLPSETNEGRFIYLTTAGDGATFDRDNAAVEAMVASFETDSPAAREVVLGYGARLELGADTAIRDGPSLAFSIVHEVAVGDEVVVTLLPKIESTDPFFGPVQADGLTWYPVLPPAPLPRTGWLAIEDALPTVLQPVCPQRTSPSPNEMGALTDQERLVCFGDTALQLRGEVPVSGLGGLAGGVWEPDWLAYPLGTWLTSDRNQGTPLRFAPGVPFPESRETSTGPSELIELAAHFDDPASTTCQVTIEGATRPEPPDQVELYCRTRLVVTEWHYAE
jgi:hypothetical protein